MTASELPRELKDVGITEHLGNSVPASLTFVDEAGKRAPFASFLGTKKPVLLTLIYYECPNLCNLLLNGLVTSLRSMNWLPGRQFELVSISINPKEGPELAARKKAAYLQSYQKPEAAPGWHFLTGEESQVRRLADSVGFGYKYDPVEKQYAHSAAIFILTPEGKVSRYLYGISFDPKDLRLALLEASRGKIGNVIDRLLLYCYHYDPQSRSYSIYVMNLVRASFTLTALALLGYLFVFWKKQRVFGRRRELPASGS